MKVAAEAPGLLTPPRHSQRRPSAAACKAPTPAAETGVHPDVLEVLFTADELHQATVQLGRHALP